MGDLFGQNMFDTVLSVSDVLVYPHDVFCKNGGICYGNFADDDTTVLFLFL